MLLQILYLEPGHFTALHRMSAFSRVSDETRLSVIDILSNVIPAM